MNGPPGRAGRTVEALRPGDEPGLAGTFPDLCNLRDVGGLPAGSRRRVRRGWLYRSATPTFLDHRQAGRLVSSLGLRTRVDLRTGSEVRETFNAHLLAAGPAVEHLPLRAGGEWTLLEGEPDLNVRVAAHYMRYLDRSPDAVVALARLAADRGRGPVLVHCTAGKDRTGVAVAILLSALGVGDDDIAEDYGRTRGELPRMWEQLASLETYAERLAALPEESSTAEPRSMHLFLDRVRATYGGARSFLLRHGADAAALDRLAEQALETG